MNSKERIMAVVNHNEVDRIPRGEFWLEIDLIKKMLGKEKITFEDEVLAYKMLNIDLRVVMLNYKVEIVNEDFSNIIFSSFRKSDFDILSRWQQKSDLFIMAGLNGPFESLCFLIGFEKLMFMIKKESEAIIEFFDKWTNFICQNIMTIINNGANGIIIADDIAYSQSTYISLKDMQYMLFPFYKKMISTLKEKNIPVFFHCDGNINNIIPDLINAGFSGLHSLEKDAGMDIIKIKNQFGKNICLMGNLGMPLLICGEISAIEKEINCLIKEMGKGGGYILGSSAGILRNDIPLRSLYLVRDKLK